MKIIVYTIMKNEIDNIDAWLENIKDADGIYVLDTGSTDGSYEYMKKRQSSYPQLHVEQKLYNDFRFDIARNDNLAMIPEQENEQIICWTIDLDERFQNGWYDITKHTVEEYPNFYKLQYYYGVVDTINSTVDNVIYSNISLYDKCHQRKYAQWKLPIHEILYYGEHDTYYTEHPIIGDETNIFVSHFKNQHTDRTQYLSLTEMRIKENQFDIEGINHLIAEYLQRGEFNKAYELSMVQYIRGLECNCNWLETICGNIADIVGKFNPNLVEYWYKQAISLNPKLGTYYIRLANYYCYGTSNSRPLKALEILNEMKEVGITQQEYFKELHGLHTWLIDDTYGIAFSWIGNYVEAYNYFYRANQIAKEKNDTIGIQITDDHMNFAKERIL